MALIGTVPIDMALIDMALIDSLMLLSRIEVIGLFCGGIGRFGAAVSVAQLTPPAT